MPTVDDLSPYKKNSGEDLPQRAQHGRIAAAVPLNPKPVLDRCASIPKGDGGDQSLDLMPFVVRRRPKKTEHGESSTMSLAT